MKAFLVGKKNWLLCGPRGLDLGTPALYSEQGLGSEGVLDDTALISSHMGSGLDYLAVFWKCSDNHASVR